MTIWQSRQVAEAERLAAYIRGHGHDAYAQNGAIAVCNVWIQKTPHRATFKAETWEIIKPNQIAVDEWLLRISK